MALLEVVCDAMHLSLLPEGAAAEDAKALIRGTQNPNGQGKRGTRFYGQLQSQVLFVFFPVETYLC